LLRSPPDETVKPGLNQCFGPGSDELDDFHGGARLLAKALGVALDLRELIHRRRARETVLLPHAFRGDVERIARALDKIVGYASPGVKKSLTTCDGE
jgi:hypothetical protein